MSVITTYYEEQLEIQRAHDVILISETVDGRGISLDRVVGNIDHEMIEHRYTDPPYSAYLIYGRVFDHPNTFRKMVLLARSEESVRAYADTNGIGFRTLEQVLKLTA
tara:strand:- start:2704 stop:3024 length:321 start_codon:yes stop_codon:yes gene_type:complete